MINAYNYIMYPACLKKAEYPVFSETLAEKALNCRHTVIKTGYTSESSHEAHEGPVSACSLALENERLFQKELYRSGSGRDSAEKLFCRLRTDNVPSPEAVGRGEPYVRCSDTPLMNGRFLPYRKKSSRLICHK